MIVVAVVVLIVDHKKEIFIYSLPAMIEVGVEEVRGEVVDVVIKLEVVADINT